MKDLQAQPDMLIVVAGLAVAAIDAAGVLWFLFRDRG